MNKIITCSRCIMDSTDPDITFNEQGHCNHCCNYFNNIIGKQWLPDEKGASILENTIEVIKKENHDKRYDGIIGLSGGVDSSYLLCKIKEWGLRPLAVHVDTGWNSEIAVRNIELLCEKLNIDLHTIVVDWESMRNVQLAFLRSGVENQDIPQDHALFASLYRYAVKNGIRYVFHGSNFATESILPESWGYDAMDAVYIKDVVRKYGNTKLKKYPLMGFFEYNIYYPYIKKMTVIKPLNYIKYNKAAAMNELELNYGWRYYGTKHGESHFTKYFQSYYLPYRFGFDKRKAHLSSLIVSGEIARAEALAEMEKPACTAVELEVEKTYISNKLCLSCEELESFVNQPKLAENLKTNLRLKKIGRIFKRILLR